MPWPTSTLGDILCPFGGPVPAVEASGSAPHDRHHAYKGRVTGNFLLFEREMRTVYIVAQYYLQYMLNTLIYIKTQITLILVTKAPVENAV